MDLALEFITACCKENGAENAWTMLRKLIPRLKQDNAGIRGILEIMYTV